MYHYLFEIGVTDRKYMSRVREELLNINCFEKFSGELNIYYLSIFSCGDEAVFIGFKNHYYIDVLSRSEDISKYVEVLTRVFPRSRINVHLVERYVNI